MCARNVGGVTRQSQLLHQILNPICAYPEIGKVCFEDDLG